GAICEPAPEVLHERALLEEHELEVVQRRMLDEVDGPEEVAPGRDRQRDHVVDGEERPPRHDGQQDPSHHRDPEPFPYHLIFFMRMKMKRRVTGSAVAKTPTPQSILPRRNVYRKPGVP